MKRLFAFVLMLAMALSTATVAFAATTGAVGGGKASSDSFILTMTPEDAAGIPKVTTDDLMEKVDTKGNELVSLIQRIVLVVCMAAFFVGLLLVIGGAIFSKRAMCGGFIAIVLSIFCSAVAMYGREVMIYFTTWLSS